MTATVAPDYALVGTAKQQAIEHGLANAEWFQPAIDTAVLRSLQERHDTRAAVDVALWLALLVGFGVWAYLSVWSWWSIPAFLGYGALYGGAADPRWHECGHGTAFRARWANNMIYPVASFMLFRGPTVWRWSHYRHHTDTIIVGRDAEISFQRPANVGRTLLVFTGVKGGLQMFWRLVRHAAGRIDPDAAEFVPASEHRKVIWESRVFIAIVAAAALWSLVAWSPLPILFVGAPTLYGMWLMVFFGLTQHAGLRENVLDHRYNTRTVYMNPVLRFLYLNMNYHVEHHLFPSVPYPALPKLHEQIKAQLAPPLPSTWAAYKQIWSTLARQQRDPSYEIPLAVPDVPTSVKHRIEVGVTAWAVPDHVAEVEADVGGDVGATAGFPIRPPGVDLGAADMVGVDDIVRVDVGERTFVLCRLGDDEYSLLDGLCTHERVHLAGGYLDGDEIECPKHNARFDARTGEVCSFPATVSLCAYPVRRVADRLIAEIDS
jgi:fatty acid desaturase/nitrite reductase/ring-hydroxylating ferredoxin subunit